MTETKRMIYHVPFPLNPQATSASGIRPVKLRRAFEAIGYKVVEVSGYHPERKRLMHDVRARVRAGERFDFVYSEAATTPTGLGEKITRHTSLTRDIRFLRFLKNMRIPVGLFYRDVYWQFDEYAERVGQPYTTLLRARYRADLRGYETAATRIFLPSMKMAEFLPEANRAQAHPLPPGAEIADAAGEMAHPALLYVGGTGSYYRMQEAVAGVEASQRATLTICTRENEWADSKTLYADVLGDHTNVVHRSGAGLDELYASTNLGALFMEPIGYRDFAAPLKLYEYLGHGKPVIATEGSLAADFVTENGFGWTIPYERGRLTELLDELSARPELLREKTERARQVRHEHTWEARARQAAKALTEG